MKRLNLGCNLDIKEGYVNLDNMYFKGVDVIHDLNKFPYPFKDNTFDEIYASQILEHLDEPIDVLRELRRITKNKGRIIIRVPGLNNGWTCIYHKHAFSIFFPDAIDNKYMTNPPKLKLIKSKFQWFQQVQLRLKWEWVMPIKLLLIPLNWIINTVASINGYTKYLFERFLGNYIGGFEEIEFIFEVDKKRK